MVVKQLIEPDLDPIFLVDSYGYRPRKSALDAVGVTRKRCWKTTGFSSSTSKVCWMLRHTTPSVFLERVEEVRSSCRYLNSYAFCPSAIDVNGLKLAALYTLQDGLP